MARMLTGEGVGNPGELSGFAPDALGEVELLAGAQATELLSRTPKAERIKPGDDAECSALRVQN